MDRHGPSTPHDLLGLTTSPAHILQPLVTVISGDLCAFQTGVRYRMDQTATILSAASFWIDDFIPRPRFLIQNTHTESIMHDHNHNIAFAFIFYFYAFWMLYNRNIFPNV